jgi:hypothetical protein
MLKKLPDGDLNPTLPLTLFRLLPAYCLLPTGCCLSGFTPCALRHVIFRFAFLLLTFYLFDGLHELALL